MQERARAEKTMTSCARQLLVVSILSGSVAALPVTRAVAWQAADRKAVSHKVGDPKTDAARRNVVFWIIRVLFEPIRPDERVPIPAIAVFLDNSANARQWPLNPMDVVEEVPFMVGRPMNLMGMAEHPSSHIAWALQHGVLREEPLAKNEPADRRRRHFPQPAVQIARQIFSRVSSAPDPSTGPDHGGPDPGRMQ